MNGGRWTPEEWEERQRLHGVWICPDCAAPLEPVSAKLLLASHSKNDRARKCTRCTYWAVGQFDWNVRDVNSKK
jgi:hypothetical protein